MGEMTGEQTGGEGGRSHDVWAVVLPDGDTKLIRDLPFDLLSQVAVAEKITELSDLIDQPLRRGAAAQRLYREAVKSLGERPEPVDTLAELRSRFRVVSALLPDDAYWRLFMATWNEVADAAGLVEDVDGFYRLFADRRDSHQWAVVLPDGTTKALCDLEWALLEIVGQRHGLTIAEVEAAPRRGDGRFTADLWRSITENQRQDATTRDMSYSQVMACFTLVPNDKPTIPEGFGDEPEDEFPEPDGPGTD